MVEWIAAGTALVNAYNNAERAREAREPGSGVLTGGGGFSAGATSGGSGLFSRDGWAINFGSGTATGGTVDKTTTNPVQQVPVIVGPGPATSGGGDVPITPGVNVSQAGGWVTWLAVGIFALAILRKAKG